MWLLNCWLHLIDQPNNDEMVFLHPFMKQWVGLSFLRRVSCQVAQFTFVVKDLSLSNVISSENISVMYTLT